MSRGVYVPVLGCEISDGDYVVCEGEDSYFEGWVVSVFPKRNGKLRLVIEDQRGLLLIKGPANITGIKSENEIET